MQSMGTPEVQGVYCGYERYGMKADLEYFEMEMQKEGDAFEIAELNWVSDGGQSKDDRVQRLQPDFLQKRFHLAVLCATKDGVPFETKNQMKAREEGQGVCIFKPVFQKDEEGNLYSLNKGFLDEYLTYPFSAKKDLIDATSRLYDLQPKPPIIIDERFLEPEVFADGS